LQIQALYSDIGVQLASEFNDFQRNSLRNGTGNFWRPNREFFGAKEFNRRVRYDEAFWRAQHEAWRRSELNQREYCEAQGIPLKAFEARKLHYRRAGLSHALSHSLSHCLGHMGTSTSYRKAERAPPLTLNDSKAPAPKTTSSRLPELRRKGRPPCRKAGTHSAQQRGVEAP
jgi:hypothetical protein